MKKCGATVLKNISPLPADKRNFPYNVYFDNLMTPMEPLNLHKVDGYDATASFRDNFCGKCP